MNTSAAARAVVVAMSTVFAARHAIAQSAAKDPCALLKAAEIQTLEPNAKIGAGILHPNPFGAGCTYEWGPRTKEWGVSTLSITVLDASKAWPGRSSDVIKQGVLLKVKRGGPNASVIPGVGDAAVFTLNERYPVNRDATAEAYVNAKGVHLSVDLHGGDLVAKKDQLIALLKTAAGRL